MRPIGFKCSPETREKMRNAQLGKRKSDEEKLSHSLRMKGRVPWNKGTSKRTRVHLTETARRWVQMNKEKRAIQARRSHLMKKFGMTLEEFTALHEAQNGQCAICSRVPAYKADSKLRNRSLLHIDHDHVTGKRRGLLCHGCNVGLGLFQDNIIALEQAITYLKKWA